jgi:hypothetical protein
MNFARESNADAGMARTQDISKSPLKGPGDRTIALQLAFAQGFEAHFIHRARSRRRGARSNIIVRIEVENAQCNPAAREGLRAPRANATCYLLQEPVALA